MDPNPSQTRKCGTLIKLLSMSTRKVYLLALGVLNGDSRVHPHFPEKIKNERNEGHIFGIG
jgi:hypothetical protein